MVCDIILSVNIYLLIVSTTTFVIGFFDLPYGYYTFLRLVVCSISAYTSYVYFSENKKINLGFIVFGFFTLLYNPIIPVHLGEKSIWIVINIITVIVFLTSFLFYVRNSRQQS